LLTLIVFIVCIFIHSLALAEDAQYQPLISGMEHYKEGKYKEALEDFQKAIIVFPDDPDVLFYIGLTYQQLNESEKAFEYFKKTLDKDPEHTDAHFQLGVVLIQKKEYKNAVSHLEQVYKKEPDREDLGYFLGFAYYQLGDHKKALSYFEKARTKDKTVASLILYYTGLAKQQTGNNKEAVIAYKKLIITDPTSPLAEPSQRLIETIEPKVVKKRFGVDFTTKVQYDDNIILVPTTNVFNLRNKEKKSIIELFYLRGEYAFIRERDYDLSASYAIYQTITNKMRDMDVQDHIVSLDFSKRGQMGAMPYDLRLNYAYDYLLSNYDYLLQRHAIRPSFILLENNANMTVFQYAFQVKEFKDKPIILEDNRDAVNHEAGFIHFLRFNDAKHHIKAGYFYDREYTDGSNWDYSGNKFVAGFQYTFPKGIRLSADYEFKMSRYKNINVYFDKKREDTERSLNTVVSKDIGKGWSVSLEYLRRRNSSNIDLYDYRKNLYSAGVSWRW
jgi:tetratricopeptide (TPR) repeat protein